MTEKKTKTTYAEKLLDPKWQKKRLGILNRDSFTCQNCGDDSKTLHVHHRCYSKGEPWEIDNRHLVTLCESCHEEETTSIKSALEHLVDAAKKSQFFASDIEDFAWGIHDCEPQHVSGVVSCAFSWALRNPEIQRQVIEMYLTRPKDDNYEWLFSEIEA